MGFTLTDLAGGSVLVEGTDNRGKSGQEVLDGTQWASFKKNTEVEDALARVDAALEDLLSPVIAAAEQANEIIKNAKALDPLFYVVEQEETEHVAGTPRIVTKLGRDAVILRAIEEGQSDRLIWVNDHLTVTAAPVSAPTPAPAPVDLGGLVANGGEGSAD